MFYVCATRFDVMGNLENSLVSGWTKQGLKQEDTKWHKSLQQIRWNSTVFFIFCVTSHYSSLSHRKVSPLPLNQSWAHGYGESRGPCVESSVALLCVTHRLRSSQQQPRTYGLARRPRQNQRPRTHFYASFSTQRQTAVSVWCDSKASHRLSFDSGRGERSKHFAPCRSPQVWVVRLLLAADVPNCSRATTGRPFMFWSIRDLQLSNAIMLVCEATHVYTVASINKTGRVSPEMLLPRAKPAPRCLADGICEHALARGASCPLQKRAQPPKLKPGDTRIRGGLTMSFIISVVYDDSVQSLSRLYHSDSSKFSADGATTDRVHVHLSATASACDHHLVADA